MHREDLKVYDNNYNNNNLQALFNFAPKVIIDTLTVKTSYCCDSFLFYIVVFFVHIYTKYSSLKPIGD